MTQVNELKPTARFLSYIKMDSMRVHFICSRTVSNQTIKVNLESYKGIQIVTSSEGVIVISSFVK